MDLAEYDGRWDRLAADGNQVHGEADLVDSLGPSSVLDAGCGTGRVALELAARGRYVIGVDNDADMLALAEAKSSTIEWILADLSTVDLQTDFDVVVMAGDVLNYVRPGDESMVVTNLAAHLAPSGRLVCGASLAEPDQIRHYDNWCRAAGLELEVRYASWDRIPYDRPGHYHVSIHRRR
ncbi:MAG: class I SAM-dependent methyltransferase [Actinomycetota bacterium]